MNMRAATRQSRLLAVALTFAFALLASSCASGLQSITVTSVDRAIEPPSYGTKDYPQAFRAILSVMLRNLQLPPVEVSVTLFPSQTSYVEGVVADAERDLQQLRKVLGPLAKNLRDEEFLARARETAVSTDAVGKHKRVLLNESRLAKYPWPEWMKVLAHELAHTVEFALVDGRPALWDRWLTEGFAEWVGYKVLDLIGTESFAKSQEQRLGLMRTARTFQTFPSLSQLATGTDFHTWARTLGLEAAYGQALIAVDYLIEQKGLAAVLEYFRLFRKSNNREQNFTTAFGETHAAFDEKFSRRMSVLLGR